MTHSPADPAAAEQTLRAMAARAIDDKTAASEQLADWVGREPSAAGEERLQLLAKLGPKLVADEVTRSGWGGPGSVLKRPQDEDLPPDVEVAMQAVIRHLNGEPDVADDILAAYLAQHGIQGMWDVGTAALRLLTAELNDQRLDAGES